MWAMIFITLYEIIAIIVCIFIVTIINYVILRGIIAFIIYIFSCREHYKSYYLMWNNHHHRLYFFIYSFYQNFYVNNTT